MAISRSWAATCASTDDDDDAFYLFLQKQKIALKPYTPPLGTSLQRILMSPTAPAPVNQGVVIVAGHDPSVSAPTAPTTPAHFRPRLAASSLYLISGPVIRRSAARFFRPRIRKK